MVLVLWMGCFVVGCYLSMYVNAAVQATTTTVTVALYGQDSLWSVDELWARLVLQAAFYTWRERLKKQQLAR